MKTQIQTFTDETKTPTTVGFVVHRITFPMFAGRFSAWFDAAGTLLDAEHIDSRNRSRPVKRNGIKWGYLATVGRVHVRNS